MRNTRHYHPHLLRKIIVFCTVILIGYSNSVLALDAEQQEFVKEQLESFERTISSNSEFFESQKTKNDYYAAIEDILQQKVDLYIGIIAGLPAPGETGNTEQSEPEDFVQEQIANYRRIVNYYPVIFKTQQDIDIYYAEIQKILKNKIDVYNGIIAGLPEPGVIATPVLCRSSTPTYGECQGGSSVLVDEIRSPAGCVGGVQSPAFKSCNNVACNYTYSYSACRPNNTKRATVTEVSPAGCVGTPIIQVGCSYTQPTGPSTCVYTYTDYGPCQSGQRTRSIIGTSPLGCSGAIPQPLSQSCSSNSPFSGIVTRKLNDTGVDQCADDNNMSTALCAIYTNDSNEYPQDANIGRDAEVRDGLLSKRGAGRKGFDFTKIANDGTELPVTATQGTGPKDWACTRDNVTGLLWEVKTTSGLHKSTDTFTWFKNGEGISNGGTCQTSGRCDMEKFTEDVNQKGLCGLKDWRVPEIDELESISDLGVRLNTLDPAYFPNTADTDSFWSNNPAPAHHPAQHAYLIFAANGGVVQWAVGGQYDLASHNVRLVSGTKMPSKYVDNWDSTVTDTTLGLMWKKDYETITPGFQSPLTMVDIFTLSDAQKRATADRTGGYSDWRLPNIKELRSLVDETRFNVAIDPAFGTVLTQSVFWSSTPAQSFRFYPDLSWVVQFNNGVPLGTPVRSAKFYIRFVRDVDEPIYCTGDIPSGTVVSAAIPTVSRPWSYSTSEEACTFRCESGLTWDGSSCGAQTAQAYHRLNDTGTDQCGDASNMSTTLCSIYESDSSDYPRQDANVGRDADNSLIKIGAGRKGFDFTKIANDGTELPATAVQGTGDKDWACTRDNVTGLIWEVKTTSGLHKSTDTFTWFKNGEGISNGGSCQTSGRCDMEKFTEDVNQEGLCGRKDWRVPEIEELESIVDYGVRLNTLDPAYFPYTADGDSFWSNNPSPAHHPAQYAYYIFAADGAVTLGYLGKYETLRNVRLVSGTKTPSNYVDNGDSTVTDTTLGLMWKKDYEMNIPGEPAADLTNLDAFTWSDALKRAAADRTGGYSDWRLPNIKELRSLVDETRFSVAIDPAFNKVFTQTHFWSSTPVQDFFFRSNQSWTVQFDDGTPQHLQLRSAKQHVRLVRDVK